MLRIDSLRVCYGPVPALHGISLEVGRGAICTLIGANGAGKSTTLRAISGLAPIASGKIVYGGSDISGLPPHKIVAAGIAHVPEGRMIFANLSVRENLLMGAYRRADRASIPAETDFVFSLFPRLHERVKQLAGTLSGGEQQMLAIGRALMSGARMLMLDEPSLGIAPILVETIFERLVEINRQRGYTILLVEQNARLALQISSYGYVLETGRVVAEGPAGRLRDTPEVQAAYLGG